MKRNVGLIRASLVMALFAVSVGLAVVFSAQADTLTVVSRLSLPYCTNVGVQGHICYVTDSYGLEAVDVSDPNHPALLGRLFLPDTAQHVILRDTIAFVSDADSGLVIVNAAKPESLALLSRWIQYPGYANESVIFQDTVYVADGYCGDSLPPWKGGLMVLNVHNPRVPAFVRHYALAYLWSPPYFSSRIVNYTSIAYYQQWYFISGPIFEWDYVNGIGFGSIDPWGILYGLGDIRDVHKMSFRYPFAYINYPSHGSSDLSIVHFSSPGYADYIKIDTVGGNGRGIWAESARVFLSLDSTVKLIDVSDSSNPTVLAACTLDNVCNGLQFKDPYVYVANGPYLTILYHTPTGVEGREGARQKAEGSLRANPNPFTSYATIPGHEQEGFELYDITGRKVRTCRGDRIGQGLAAGVYFVRSQVSTSTSLRIVKVR